MFASSILRGNTNNIDGLIFALFALILGVYRSFSNRKSYLRIHKTRFHHVILSSTELFLYYSRSECSLFAAATCLAQVITSFQMAKRLRNGNTSWTRPLYQAGCIVRGYQILRGYIQQSAAYYHDAILLLSGFFIVRFLIFYFGRLRKMPLTDKKTIAGENDNAIQGKKEIREDEHARDEDFTEESVRRMREDAGSDDSIYTVSLFVATSYLVSRSRHYVSATTLYLLLFYSICRLSQWVTMKRSQNRELKNVASMDYVVNALHSAGIRDT